ncbi:aminotransferase class I/II-fold pyridoxal phosphate-dependent enzyme [Amycolatopsis sp. NPDC051061]|uniref:aminotransferase class I/II-fold pyridoxal phosphate-dependent enzyme n=1 Tax=Amycolatopsis sp. NPDC051061 TaxID=3155042 RepID=UPI003438FBF9
MEWEASDRCNLAGCENDRPSPRALEAIQRPTSPMLTDHWDPQDSVLRSTLGRQHGVPADQVFLTSGAMGAIRYSFEVFGNQSDRIGLLSPDWPGFRFFAERSRRQVTWLEHHDFPFHFTIDEVAKFVNDNGVDFTVVSNPSAVTGKLWSREDIDALLQECPRTMFVIDEADAIYPTLSVSSLVNHHDNVLVLGSFSKFYGLSGLRIGYLICPAQYSWAFENTIDVIELTSLAIVAAREALCDTEYQQQTQREVAGNLERLTTAAATSNYQLVPGSQCFAAYLYGGEHVPDPLIVLADKGIDLVPAKWFGLPRGGRLNLRNPGSIDRLISALDVAS